MVSLREWLQDRPAIGYALVGIVVLVALTVAYMQVMRPSESQELGQFITIKDSETGETWQFPLGAIERDLHGRDLPINPKEGLPNPTTGKRTGFPEKDWEKMIQRVLAERQQGMAERQQTPAPKP